ncbi:MAG: HAMP domain-containing histidine kinase, partial [Oscillospiraceae bacterium]|nr:HAMP domain-containing histidine kinase [Oscillospiraceae bacterium]
FGDFVVVTQFFVVLCAFLVYILCLQKRNELIHRSYIDNITHEMKSPIASIRALAEALTDGMGKDNNERNVYYGMMIGEANRQEKMILEALTLAKLQTRRSRPPRQRMNPDAVFRPVCDKYATLCDLVDITFEEKGIQELPELYSNQAMLQQVLETLLSNARKFVQEGGTISLSATVQRKRVIICVADDGVGIAPEDLPHVFERFYKGSQSGNGAGSGLGLAIAKEAMKAMGEKIWIRSEENHGTQVYFTIARA